MLADRRYLLCAISAQQYLRGSVLKGPHAEGVTGLTPQSTLNDSAEPNICYLSQVLSGIEQDIFGLQIHVYELQA